MKYLSEEQLSACLIIQASLPSVQFLQHLFDERHFLDVGNISGDEPDKINSR